MLDDDIVEAARRLLDICKRKNLTVATAESCTAGLVAGTLTEIPGVIQHSRSRLHHLFQSGQAGHARCVGRDAAAAWRGQSRETAEQMARGALAHAPVDLAVSVTGIAGPDGGTDGKAGRPRAFWRRHALGPTRPCRETVRRDRARRSPETVGFAGLPDAARSRRARDRARAARLTGSAKRSCDRRPHRRAVRMPPQSAGTRSRTSRPSACRACGS